MARKYNIVEQLAAANIRPFIQIKEDMAFEVDTSYLTALRIQALAEDAGNEEDKETNFFDATIEISLGKKALKEIKAIEPPLSSQAYQVLIEAIMAAIGGEELDTTAQRFPDEPQT